MQVPAMQVTVEDSGPNHKTLRVTVPVDRVKSHIDKVYKAASRQVQLKGFRPGKVPRNVITQHFGDQILAEAKEAVINETFQEAMRSNELDVIGQPTLDVSNEPLKEDEELSYTVEIDVKPAVKVGNIKSIEISRNDTEATDEDLESVLDQQAQSKRKLQAVDGEIADGDFAKVDIRYVADGREVVKKEGLQINAAIPIRGCDPEEFRGKLTGRTKGETVAIPITYPDTFEKEDVRGQSGDVELTIHEIMRFVAPPVDEEFAKGLDFESLDAMKTELRTRITDEKDRLENTRIEEEVLDQLFAENPYELPDALVQDEVKHRLASYAEELEKQGATKEEAEKRCREARSEVEEASRKGIRNLFLIEAISKKEKLFVTETDVENELKQVASANDTSLAEVRKYFEEKKLFAELRLDLMNRKVREFLRQTVTMTDSDSSDPGE